MAFRHVLTGTHNLQKRNYWFEHNNALRQPPPCPAKKLYSEDCASEVGGSALQSILVQIPSLPGLSDIRARARKGSGVQRIPNAPKIYVSLRGVLGRSQDCASSSRHREGGGRGGEEGIRLSYGTTEVTAWLRYGNHQTAPYLVGLTIASQCRYTQHDRPHHGGITRFGQPRGPLPGEALIGAWLRPCSLTLFDPSDHGLLGTSAGAVPPVDVGVRGGNSCTLPWKTLPAGPRSDPAPLCACRSRKPRYSSVV